MYYMLMVLFLGFSTQLLCAAKKTPEKKEEAIKYLSASGDVSWESIGNPGFLRIHGKGGKITGRIWEKDGLTHATLAVALDAFTTGISLRDQHMKDKYLDTATHRTALLSLDPIKLEQNKEITWSGKLRLKGVEKPVSGVGILRGKEFSGSFSIAVSDFGIEIPSYLGVTMAKDVDISVTAVSE